MYEIGTGKAEITAFKPSVGMMGYGMFHNRVRGVDTKLFARAFVLKDLTTNRKIAFVNAEICFITISIKRGVIKRLKRKHEELGYDYQNVLLTAQHTHSGPSGYSHYGLYNISTPGFVPEVYQTIVDGITDAILQAEANLQPGKIKLTKGEFAPEIDVAFNRSVNAYNQNPEVQPKLSEQEAHLALDRQMTMFRMESITGKPLGALNFFGLHCTSIHNDNNNINADNKGYASVYHEEAVKQVNPDFISIFAQNVTGDITPNYVLDKKKKWTRGPFESDVESAQYSGKLQFDKAQELFAAAANGEEVSTGIDYGMTYANFANIHPHTDFTNGDKYAHTSPSCHGVAFLAGTKEGPGMDPIGKFFSQIVAKVIKHYEKFLCTFHLVSKLERKRIMYKYEAQGKKDIIIEAGDRKLLATYNVKKIIIPAFIDPTVKYFKQFHRTGGLDHKPWTPQTLPLHIVIMGRLAFASIPGEITTIAGRRLEKTILDVLSQRGVEEVILCSYSNAYFGYITTFEEYQVQAYEGGHTVFGEWTLAAFQTKYRELAREMLRKPEDRNIDLSVKPVNFTPEDLEKRQFAYKG